MHAHVKKTLICNSYKRDLVAYSKMLGRGVPSRLLLIMVRQVDGAITNRGLCAVVSVNRLDHRGFYSLNSYDYGAAPN